MSDSTGSTKLNYSTRLDVSEIVKNSEIAIAALKKVGQAAKGINDPANATGQKSMTQAVLDATKANNEYATSLEQERLKAIQLKNLKDEIRVQTLKDNAQIKQNTLTQQELNIAKKAQLELDKAQAAAAKESAAQHTIPTSEGFPTGSGAQEFANATPIDGSSIAGIDALIQQYNADLAAGTITATEYRAAIEQISIFQARMAETTVAAIVPIEEEVGAIEGLKLALKDLNAQRIGAAESDLPVLNREIQEMEIALSQALNKGKVGFDEFGNKIKAASVEVEEQVGLLGQLQAKLVQLKAANPTILDRNALIANNAEIQSTQRQISQLSNIGKKGFDELGNAIPTENVSRFSLALGRATNLSNIGATVVSRLSRQIIGLGVGMLSFAIGAKAIEFLVDYISNLEIFAGKLNAAKQALKAYNDIQDAAAKSAAPNIANLKILYDSATDVSQAYDKRVASAEKLKELFPNELGSVNALALANGKLKSKIDEVSDALLKQATTEAALGKIRELEAQKLELQAKQLEIQAKADLDKSNAKGYAAGSSGGLPGTGGGSYQPAITAAQNRAGIQQMADYQKNKLDPQIRAIDQTIALVTKAAGGAKVLAGELEGINKLIQNPLENFDTIVKNAGSKADLDNLKASLQAKLNSLAPNDAQIKAYDAAIKKVLEIEKKYQPKPNDGQGEKSAAQTQLEAQTTTLQAIDALKAKYAAKQGTRDEQAVDAIKANFKTQVDNITALNLKYDTFVKKYGTAAATAAGLKRIDPTTLQPLENDAIAAEQAKQGVADLKNQIEQQKAIFKEYEDYKLKAGTDAANKLYGNELKGFKSYVDYLKSLAPAEAQLNSNIPAEKAAASAKQDLLLKIKADGDTADAVATKKHLGDLILQNQDYEQQRATLIANANSDIALLQKAGDADGVIQAKKNLDDRLTALDEANFKALASYKELFDGIDQLSTKAAKMYLDKLYVMAAAALATGEITVEAYDKIIKNLDVASEKNNDKLPRELKEIGSVFNSLGVDVGKFDEGLGKALSTIGGLVIGVGTIKQSLNDLSKSGAGTFDKITASLGIIGSAFTLVTGVVSSIQDGERKQTKQIADAQAYNNQQQIKANEAITKQLERQLALIKDIYGTARLDSYSQSLADITKAQADQHEKLTGKYALTGYKDLDDYITKLNNGEKIGVTDLIGQGNKVLFDTLKQNGGIIDLATQSITQLQKLLDNGSIDANMAAIVQSLIELKKQYQDTLNALNAETVGQTFDTLLDNILDLFKNATTGAQDFADNFQSIIQQSILQSFSREYLQTQLQGFYKDLAKFSGPDSGAVLDAGEIKQLQDEYNTAIENAKKGVTQIEKITGQKLGTSTNDSSSPTSQAGQISAALTEDTGTRIYGVLAGTQLAAVQIKNAIIPMASTLGDLYQVASKSFDTLIRIDKNTLRSANNTDVLPEMLNQIKTISNNSGGDLAYLARAAGKYGF